MSPKFCAGCTIEGREVESIHPAREIATTGTPAAFLAKPDGKRDGEIEFWGGFALVVACFVVVVIEDRVRG